LFTTIAVEAGVSWSLADAVFAMLAGRLIVPASKRRTHRWIVDDVVAPAGFSFPTLEQYYRALDVVHANKDVIERHVYDRVCDLTNLNLTLACYDLTSTYLEGDPAGHSRFLSKAFGYSRARRSDRPQVVIGLLTSADGIPIAHHVFAGGTQDATTTLKGVLEDLTTRFAVGRISRHDRRPGGLTASSRPPGAHHRAPGSTQALKRSLYGSFSWGLPLHHYMLWV
jgi:hypothetical protein